MGEGALGAASGPMLPTMIFCRTNAVLRVLRTRRRGEAEAGLRPRARPRTLAPGTRTRTNERRTDEAADPGHPARAPVNGLPVSSDDAIGALMGLAGAVGARS